MSTDIDLTAWRQQSRMDRTAALEWAGANAFTLSKGFVRIEPDLLVNGGSLAVVTVQIHGKRAAAYLVDWLHAKQIDSQPGFRAWTATTTTGVHVRIVEGGHDEDVVS